MNRTTREHFEEHGEGHWREDHHQGQRQRQRGQGDFNHKTDDGKISWQKHGNAMKDELTRGKTQVGRKDGQPLPGEDEPLHAYVTAPDADSVNKAVRRIRSV